MSDDALSNLLHEERRFPPPPEFAAQANVGAQAYADAAEDRLAFWEAAARRLWARCSPLPPGSCRARATSPSPAYPMCWVPCCSRSASAR